MATPRSPRRRRPPAGGRPTADASPAPPHQPPDAPRHDRLPPIPIGSPTPHLASRRLTRAAPIRRALLNDAVLAADAALDIRPRHITTGAAVIPIEHTAATCEPSVAINGNLVLLTGRFSLAVSTDGGQFFTRHEADRALPMPAGASEVVDQVVLYAESIDRFIWTMIYRMDGHENILRVAWATTAQLQQFGPAPGNAAWPGRFLDLTPSTNSPGTGQHSLALPGRSFDFPDAAVSTSMYYVSGVAFALAGSGQDFAAFVVRIPLADMASGQPVPHVWHGTDLGHMFRFAQQSDDPMYFAAHRDTSHLRVFRWAETAAAPEFADAEVRAFVASGALTSLTPGNQNWLEGNDSRLLGGTLAGTELWFAWGPDSGGTDDHRHPYVQIARLDATTFDAAQHVIVSSGNPVADIASSTAAVHFGALASNAQGEVAATYLVGGGDSHPTLRVAILTPPRKDFFIHASTGDANQRWGDYLTIRRHVPDGRLFAATGYTADKDHPTRSIVSFVIFGRARDVT
jgi:hypothetical protein